MGRWNDAGVTLEGFFRAGIGFCSSFPFVLKPNPLDRDCIIILAPLVNYFPDLLPHEERNSTRRAKHPRVCPSPETPADADKVSYAHTLPQDVTGSIYAIREKKAFHPFVSHECVPDLINACILTSSLPDCPCPTSCHRLLHMPPSCRISHNPNMLSPIPPSYSRIGHDREPSTKSCAPGSLGSNLGSKVLARASSRSSAKRVSNVVFPLFSQS